MEFTPLLEKHLMHFNSVARQHPDKPVWWVVAQAIKRFETMNGERGMSGGARG